MKKIISLLLVLVMVFSMTAFASAVGNSFTDIYNSKNEDAIEFLYDLGLVEGYSVTKFGPKKNLTRAEACALIVRALIEDDEIYANTKDTFVDVDYYAWYREWVDTAYRHNIMHGYGNAKFGPEDHVTYAQYATILVNALGYDSLNFEGTWPANVEELAIKLDLYDNVSIHVSDDEITREDAAQMLYNALWCKMVGMRGVTLYDVVTEKYAPKIVTQTGFVTVVDYTKNWVAFTMGTSDIYYCDIENYDAHIEIGHSDYATVHFNADYSEVYGVDRIWCVEPETEDDYTLVAEGWVTGHIAKDNDGNIINLEVNYTDIAVYADAEWIHQNNVENITKYSYVRIYQCAVGCHCKVEHWGVVTEPQKAIFTGIVTDVTRNENDIITEIEINYISFDCVPNMTNENPDSIPFEPGVYVEATINENSDITHIMFRTPSNTDVMLPTEP